VQQISLNSPDLKIPVDAVAEYILRAPASGIVALIGIDSDQLRVLLDHTEVAQGRRRALFLSFDRLQNAAMIVERTMDALADTAMQMWPVWYSSVSFADLGNDTLGREAARARLHEIAKLIPHVSLTWAERAVAMALDGGKLRVPEVARATELEQLCLVINRAGLVLITNSVGSEAEASALVHALEWMTRNAHIAVVVLFERLPEGKSAYDRILYGVQYIEQAERAASSTRTHDFTASAWLAPVQGMPHPLSATEQKLAKAIALDGELARLFGYNLFVETVRGSRPKVDLLWSAGRLVIELDGYPDHGNRLAFMYDRHRDYELALSGYTVLRLANDEIAQDIGKALEKIRDMVHLCRARIGVKS
jgi:very-short-patch-repair endonuclease